MAKKISASTRTRAATISGSRTEIPPVQTRKWAGMFSGEFAGNVFATKNIDLQRSQNKLAISDSHTANAISTSLGNLTTPTAFIRTAADGTDRYWALGGRLFKTTGTNPQGTWAQDAIASTPTAPLYDMIEFASALIVAKDTDLTRLSGGTWTAAWWTGTLGAAALTTAVPHRFAILAGALLVTNGRYVASYDGTIVTTPDLTLPSQFQAQFIITTQDLAYIGTKSLNAGNAEVFAWDRSNTNYTARYDIGDSECLCGFLVGGIPYIVTKKGVIKRFTGQAFTQVQAFPSAEVPVNINNIDPNGVTVDGNTVKILVDFGVISSSRLRSGLWTFEADTLNLYHSGSVKNNAGKDYSQSELFAAGALRQTIPGQGRYLLGASPYTVYSGTKVFGIFTLDESATAGHPGYYMTPKIKAGNVRRFWRQLFVRFANFQNSTDRIRVAYRTLDSTTLPAYETITWVTATTFTGSNANVAVGDFVEILAGDNAGALAKITTIVAGSPKTFTIDLTLNASTNTARATYLRFTDLGTVTAQSIQEAVFRPLARSNWIQYLIELRGSINSPLLEELIQDGGDVPL